MKTFFWVCLLYIFFFNPNVASLGSLLVRLVYPILIVNAFCRHSAYLKLLKNTIVENSLVVLLLAYSILLSLFAKGNIDMLKGCINLSLGVFLTPSLILILGYSGRNSNKIFRLVIISGFVAVAISCICFIFPEINDIIRNIQFKEDNKISEISYRGFGFSNGLFFYFSIILSVITIFSISRIENKAIVFLFFFLFNFVVLINARIGFLPLMIWVIYKMLHKVKLFFYIVIILILFIWGVSWLASYYDDSLLGFVFKWLLAGIGQITNPLLGTNFDTLGENHFETLGGTMVVYPADYIHWLMGSGINLFGRVVGNNSDVGYVIQLYYGGIIFLMLLIGLIVFMFVRLLKRGTLTKNYRCFPYLFMGIVLIANVKGDFLVQINNGFLFLFFCYCVILYEKKYVLV